MPKNIPSDIAPAQRVGGMRVKHPDARRTSLKNESKEATSMNENNEDNRNEEEEEERRQRELQERQAQDMQNHAASRQPDIGKNAGSNVHIQYMAPTQPRAMNH
jgi:predicted phage gp36 major capsid-like protein